MSRKSENLLSHRIVQFPEARASLCRQLSRHLPSVWVQKGVKHCLQQTRRNSCQVAAAEQELYPGQARHTPIQNGISAASQAPAGSLTLSDSRSTLVRTLTWGSSSWTIADRACRLPATMVQVSYCTSRQQSSSQHRMSQSGRQEQNSLCASASPADSVNTRAEGKQ